MTSLSSGQLLGKEGVSSGSSDKYAKVGEADNVLLKFRKVGGRPMFHAAQL
jgi:hypothetical protein